MEQGLPGLQSLPEPKSDAREMQLVWHSSLDKPRQMPGRPRKAKLSACPIPSERTLNELASSFASRSVGAPWPEGRDVL